MIAPRAEGSASRYAILVLEKDGEPHYVEDESSGRTVVYTSKRKAEADAEFWREGLGDEVQSVNVVRYRPPRGAR